MWSRESFSNWTEISLEAVGQNTAYFVRNTDAQVMAVVKANGYGHDMVRAARAAVKSGATWCGVSRVDEALELRRAGVDCPILILGLTPAGRMQEAIAARVSMTVSAWCQVEAASAAALRVGEQGRLHLKVDTGMSRLGVHPADIPDMAGSLVNTSGVVFEGVLTHFARADELDQTPTEAQEQCFQDVLTSLTASGLRPPLAHAANSAATLTRPSSHFDLVRVGIAMYGLHPSLDCPLPQEFRPALSWKTRLIQVRQLPSGRGISYGHDYVTTREELIGTVSVGYADGFRRVNGNVVLVDGRQASVVGRVCMDHLLVQLDGVPEAQAGDGVVLIGTQSEMSISAEDLAQRWGTINYEVVCNIASRVPRVYV